MFLKQTIILIVLESLLLDLEMFSFISEALNLLERVYHLI